MSTYIWRESLRQAELSNKDIGFLKFFDAIFSLPSLHDPGGWAERLHHVRAWSLGMDVAGGAQRLVLLGRKETSEHRETFAQGENNERKKTATVMTLHQFCFFLSSCLTCPPPYYHHPHWFCQSLSTLIIIRYSGIHLMQKELHSYPLTSPAIQNMAFHR